VPEARRHRHREQQQQGQRGAPHFHRGCEAAWPAGVMDNSSHSRLLGGFASGIPIIRRYCHRRIFRRFWLAGAMQ
jgi:hypothetical protein